MSRNLTFNPNQSRVLDAPVYDIVVSIGSLIVTEGDNSSLVEADETYSGNDTASLALYSPNGAIVSVTYSDEVRFEEARAEQSEGVREDGPEDPEWGDEDWGALDPEAEEATPAEDQPEDNEPETPAEDTPEEEKANDGQNPWAAISAPASP